MYSCARGHRDSDDDAATSNALQLYEFDLLFEVSPLLSKVLDAHPSLLGSVVDRLVRAAKITAENDPEDRPSLDVTRALEHVVNTCSKDRVEQFVREAYGSQLLNNAVQRSAAWRRFVGYCVNRGIISNTIVEASKNRVKNVLNTETIWIKELRKEEESEENLVVRDVRVVTDDVDPKLRDDALEAEVVRWEDNSNNTLRVPWLSGVFQFGGH